MSREVHVRFWERAGVRFPRATRLPLHRQAEIYAREDIDLSRSTLADMVGQVAGLVRPLIDALSRYVMTGERVHGDDTEVPVLEPGLGRTRKARLWTYLWTVPAPQELSCRSGKSSVQLSIRPFGLVASGLDEIREAALNYVWRALAAR